MTHRRVWYVFLAATLSTMVLAAPMARGQGDSGSPKAAKAPKTAAERLVESYVRLYGEHLRSPDWIARSMAVIALAEVDDPRTTSKLVEVLHEDRKTLVKVFAWEALLARHSKLSDEQRATWSAAGKRLASRDALHGDLRVGLVRLIGAEGPTADNKKVFKRLFTRTNALDPSDIRTIHALRDALARWKSPGLVKPLIAAMSSLDDAYRAEIVLRGLPSGVPHSRTLIDKGSKVMWRETQKAWSTWFAGANLQENQAATTRLGGMGSYLIGEPESIGDPSDPRWRKHLELPPLRLKSLDVVFAVDTTGSMGEVIVWLQRNVIKMMRALAIISREPRIGLVFYRDRGDAYVVKPVPLTGNAGTLVKALEGAKAHGGGDVPEAVYDALVTAVGKMKWVSAHKVIVVAGDAPPHEADVAKATQLVEQAVEKGFRFHFIKACTQWGSSDLKIFDSLAALGKGSSTAISFYEAVPDLSVPRRTTGYESTTGGSWVDRARLTAIASVDYTKAVDRQVVAAVLRSVLNKAYHGRAEPFANVILEHVERFQKEKRRSFGPRPPQPVHTHHGPVRRHREPSKPKDPQKR